MDWDKAVERYRKDLLRIVATFYTLIGLTEGGSIERISLKLYRRVLARLRPAEAAVRRLIIIMAQGLEVAPAATRAARKEPTAASKGKPRSKRKRRRLFLLFDPRLRLDAGLPRRPKAKGLRTGPRIRNFDTPAGVVVYVNGFLSAPQPQPKLKPVSDGTVSAVSLCRRLAAILDALKDMPRQAARYARWRAKPIEERRPQLETPLRRGAPPGLRETSSDEVQEILKECHWLVRSLPVADTS